MLPKAKVVWLDGSLVPWSGAKVHMVSHSLHYGSGVFEGMRCYGTRRGPAIFRLRDHIARLFRSAETVFMKIPFTPAELIQASKNVVAENGFEDCYVRPIAIYGYGTMGLNLKENPVNVAIAAWPWGAYLGEEGLRDGIRVITSSWMKTPSNSIPALSKVCGNYVNSLLAHQEALRAGVDEAILLNSRGYVAEGSGENLFIVKDEVIFTPPLNADVLQGITRDSVMALAADAGYNVKEENLSRGQLYSADEAFLTGSAAEVTPVREVDGHPVGLGKAGPITKELQSHFFKAVRGEVLKYEEWLGFVREK